MWRKMFSYPNQMIFAFIWRKPMASASNGLRPYGPIGPEGSEARKMDRSPWIEKRKGHTNVSQMHYARKGAMTEEMAFVADREDLDPELVRSEIARGRMIIPANINHASLEPMCIGIASKCKINANIGNSAVSSNVDQELEKLHYAVHLGADTAMDLSTGGDLDLIRTVLIQASPIPIGTVPIYQALKEVGEKPEELTLEVMLDVIGRQVKQ